MISNYKNIEFQLYGYLVQMRELFKLNNIDESEIEKLNENIELIQRRIFKIAVMGEFKRGKSSLINAMLGTKILPADVTPATATVNRITYGTEAAMTIYYHDGRIEGADIKNISDYVTMLTEKGLERAEQIREAVIQYPTVICQNHVDIIDTPGLNDNADMTRITMNILSNIDAAIVVVSALSPFSEKETNFVCELIKSDNIENIVFVVTYIDQIDEDEQDKLIQFVHERIRKSVLEQIHRENQSEEVLRKAERLMEGSLIFGVSSLLALKAFVSGDRKLLKSSRFETFKSELYDFVTAQQGVNLIMKAIKGVKHAANTFNNLYCQKILKLEQEITMLDEKCEEVRKFSVEGRKKFEMCFRNNERLLKGCLSDILDFNNVFINNFANRLMNLQGIPQNQIMDILSSEAYTCWKTANEACTEKTKSQIFTAFISSVNSYKSLRNAELIEPLQQLKRMFDLQLNLSSGFEQEVTKIMIAFGFPKFSWQISPLPNTQYLYNYNYMNNVKYAVNVSIQKFHEYWSIYINFAKNWWLQQCEQELSTILSLLNNQLKERREEMVHEMVSLKNVYEQQKPVIKELSYCADKIYKEAFDSNNAAEAIQRS